MRDSISRRSFLRGAAMAAASLLAASCAPTTPEVTEPDTPAPTQAPAATATPVPAKFNEAPMLAEMVAAGTLPPVEERLPLEPMVMDVFDEIGKYGGTIRRAFVAPGDIGCNTGRFNGVMPCRWTNDGIDVIPYIAKSWEPVEGGKAWIFNLREGMKWSDGAPFTADDWVYQYEDVFANDELKGGKPDWFKGPDPENPVVVTKVDDYTVKFTYPKAFYPLPQMFAALGCLSTSLPYSPAHYFKQFHKKYAGDKAEELAKAAGFETWVQYYSNRENYQLNIERPSTRPWLLRNTNGEQVVRTERNPYYPVVDPAGNQLPYVDEVRYDLVSGSDVVILRAIEGGIDFQARHIETTAIPVLKENEEKGGYNLVLVPGFGGNDCMFNINISYGGPEQVVLANRDFRLALSHAIDRNFIQEVAFVGLGTISNYLPAPDSPQHPGPEWETKHMEYDVDMANELLDKVVPDRDSDGFRTLPDGSRLEIVISVTPRFGPWPDVAEQVAQYWSDVGVRARPDIMERSLLNERNNANECMVYVWGPGRAVNVFVQSPWIDCSSSCPWGVDYQIWYATNGEAGTEPPDEVKRLTEIVVEGRGLPPEEANPMAQEIYKWIIDNQVIIGTVRRSPMVQGVTVVNKKLGNVPPSWANDTTFNTPWTAYPEQFYYKE